MKKLFELFHGFTSGVNGCTIILKCPCGKEEFRFTCSCSAYPTRRDAGCPVHYPTASWPVLRALWSIGQLKRLNLDKCEEERLSLLFKNEGAHKHDGAQVESTRAASSVPNCS